MGCQNRPVAAKIEKGFKLLLFRIKIVKKTLKQLKRIGIFQKGQLPAELV